MRSPACFFFVVLWVGSAIWPGPAGTEQQGAAASESALSAGEILEQRCSGCPCAGAGGRAAGRDVRVIGTHAYPPLARLEVSLSEAGSSVRRMRLTDHSSAVLSRR